MRGGQKDWSTAVARLGRYLRITHMEENVHSNGHMQSVHRCISKQHLCTCGQMELKISHFFMEPSVVDIISEKEML